MKHVATRSRYRSTSAVRRRKLRTGRVLGVVAGSVAIFSVVSAHAAAAIHEGGRRALAERLTRAMSERNIAQVQEIVTPELAAAMSADIRLGALSDRLQDLGVLKSVRVERAGNGSAAWKLIATFARGTQSETMRFAGDRVTAFAIADASNSPDRK